MLSSINPSSQATTAPSTPIITSSSEHHAPRKRKRESLGVLTPVSFNRQPQQAPGAPKQGSRKLDPAYQTPPRRARRQLGDHVSYSPVVPGAPVDEDKYTEAQLAQLFNKEN